MAQEACGGVETRDRSEGEDASLVAPALKLLRDKAGVTRLLILAELEREPGTTLSDIAGKLDVTVQAVSAYAKQMADDGLLAPDGPHRVSPKGLQTLHEGVRQLRAAIDAVATPLAVIRVASAIAATKIKENDRVGLVMQAGELHAKARTRAASMGRALADADVGDEVVVGDLTGLVELTPGRIRVVALPSPMEGGIARVDVPRLRGMLKELPRADKVGALGTGARVLASRLGPLDLDFAAARAAFNAAERGLDVRLFVTRDRLPEAMQAFEQGNAGTLKRVGVELVEAPELG